jgi:hypothetical protein
LAAGDRDRAAVGEPPRWATATTVPHSGPVPPTGWTKRFAGFRSGSGVADTGRHAHRPFGSRLLHGIDRVASRPALVVLVVTCDVVWMLYGSLVGSHPVGTIFQTPRAAAQGIRAAARQRNKT